MQVGRLACADWGVPLLATIAPAAPRRRVADMVRLDLLVNGEPVDAMAKVVHRDEASRVGRRLVTRLQAIMQRELFDVVLQVNQRG